MRGEEIPEKKGGTTMKELFVANGKIIDKEEAERINKRNYELLAESEKSGDWDYLSDIVFILPLKLAMELA